MGGVYTENLLKRTKDFSGDSWYNTGIKWSKESEKIDGYTVISSDKSWGGMGCFVSVEGGKHYTYSFNAKTETSNYIYISVVISGSLDHDINGIFGRFVFIEGSEYKQYSIYIDPEEYCELYIGVEHRSNVVGKTWVYGEKLECGINQYPFWTPNPTDVYTE